MSAMVEHNTRSHRDSSGTAFKTADVVSSMSRGSGGGGGGDCTDARLWQQLYTAEEAAAAIGRCKNIAYNEKLSVLGDALITAHPSGFAIGSCNWVVNAGGT